MRVAIIGAGGPGGAIGRLLARAGHEVVFTESPTPRSFLAEPEMSRCVRFGLP
jgi:predicted dinucleotide-binding enzyme